MASNVKNGLGDKPEKRGRATRSHPDARRKALGERQRMVLRAIVAAYVAEAEPASSTTVKHLLPVALSSASIRNTMAELAGMGLIEKPHASAGRVPTECGLREFVDRLLDTSELAEYERRSLQSHFENVDGDSVMRLASQLLSEHTHQLGFAMVPRLERITLRHVSLVRVARDKVLVVLIPQAGPAHQQVIDEPGHGDQVELDQMAADLNERVMGRTLIELREVLAFELDELRRRANQLMARTVSLGLRVVAIAGEQAEADLVIASHRALLSQPEFNDPDRIRALFSAVETNERLLEVLTRVLEGQVDSVSVSLGEELAEPGLRECALVAVPYGFGVGPSRRMAEERAEASRPDSSTPLGVLGVIGPSRMDYARVIPLVSYCSKLVTEKLNN